MTRFFDDLEAQLHAAARREVAGAAAAAADRPPHGAERAAREPRRLGWLWSGLRAVPVVSAVVVSLLVVGGAFVLLGHGSGRGSGPGPAGGGPSGGPGTGLASIITPQVRQELKYIERANAQVMGQRSCQSPSATQRTVLLRGRPSPALPDELGVLRRRATGRDHLSRQLLDAMGGGVYLRTIRLARVIGGHRYYVVVQRTNVENIQPPAHCFTQERSVLRRMAPHIPAALRTPTEHLEDQLLAFLRAQLRPADALCLVDLQRGGSGSSCGLSARQVRTGQTGISVGQGPAGPPGLATGVVPDGVATVTMAFGATRGHRPFSATGDVVGNVYAVQLPPWTGMTNAMVQPERIVLRAASGRVLRSIDAGNAGYVAACRRDPIPCIAVMGAGTTSSGASSSSSSATATAPVPTATP